MSERIVVVGAGLSGLAAAHRLRAAGREVVVLEQGPVVGGCAATEHVGGYVVDTGCDLINRTFTRYLALVVELGLGDLIERGSGSADVVRDERPIHLDPRRPHRLAATPLLSARSKAVAAAGFARLAPTLRRFDAYALTKYDEHAYGTGPEFVARYFDAEIGARLLDPLVRAFTGSGIEHASGLAVLATLKVGTAPALAVRGGMRVVPEAIAARLDVRLQAEATAIEEAADGVTVAYRDPAGEHELRADACVLAASFAVGARLWPALTEAAPGVADRLRDLGLISVSLGYDAPSPSPALAIMVPTGESAEALLGFHQHNKASDRAPAGKSLITLYSDSAVTGRLLERTDAELGDWAGDLIERLYPGLGGRRELTSVTRWPHVGYVPYPGYWEAVGATQRALAGRRVVATSALFGSGGVEHAVVGGERAAARVLERPRARVAA